MGEYTVYLLLMTLLSATLLIEGRGYGRNVNKKTMFKAKSHSRTGKLKGRTADASKPAGSGSVPMLDFRKDRPGLEALDNKTSNFNRANAAPIQPCPLASFPPVQTRSYQGDESQIIAERIIEQNRYILLQSHKAAIFGLKVPADGIPRQEPAASLLLLNLTGETFKRYCPVPGTYVENAIQVFSNLHNYVNPERDSYVSEEEYNWIAYILGKCASERGIENFLLNRPCSDDIIGSARSNEPICPNSKYWSTDPNYDAVVETIWRVFEVVHSACFEKFHGYYRLWHRFAMAIEDLFTQPIKQRWRTPMVQGKNWDNVYVRLLGPNYEKYNRNIDKCADFYAEKSPLKARLDRFIAPHTIRYSHDNPHVFDDPIIKELERDFVAVAAATAAEANPQPGPGAPGPAEGGQPPPPGAESGKNGTDGKE